ncbi:MAG: efflux RND transporter permease subunit [Fibrobacterota bacterium]
MLKVEHIVAFLSKNRIKIALAVLLGTVFFAAGLTRLTIDNDTMKSVPASLPERQALDSLDAKFDAPFTLLVLLSFEDKKETLSHKIAAVKDLADTFLAVQIEEKQAITNVTHIEQMKVPVNSGGFVPRLTVEDLIPRDTAVSEEELEERLETYDSLIGSLMSESGDAFTLVLDMNRTIERPLIVERLVSIVERENEKENIAAHITGGTAMSYFISEKTKKDFILLLPLCLLISTLLLYIVFRRKLYVFLSLLVISIAVIWTFGFMGWTGTPLSVVTSVIPIILFPIGVADSIHLLKTFSRLRWRERMPFEKALEETYRELLRPIILTSITTFIGFSSFIFSDISWTRTFGIFTGLGVMLALIFSLLLLPIFLYYEKEHELHYHKARVRKPSRTLYNFITKHIFNIPVHIAALIVIVVVSFAGINKIYFETNPMSMFSENSTIVQSDKRISKNFHGTRFFDVVLTQKDGDLNNPESWESINDIVSHTESLDAVGNVISILPFVKEAGREVAQTPFSATAINLLFESRNRLSEEGHAALQDHISADNASLKLTLVCKNIDDPKFDYREIAENIEAYIAANHDDFDPLFAGPALLTNATLDLLVDTQIDTLILAIIFVFIILVLLFKSVKIGLYTTIPIILSTLMTYALMGLFGVSINLVTVIVINTCIGIGIDYSIHFTSGFLFYQKSCSDNRKALTKTVFNKGSVILFNTMVVGAGFLVLIFSNFPPIRSFGLFIFISMIISSLFSILFLPVLLRNIPAPQDTQRKIAEKNKKNI